MEAYFNFKFIEEIVITNYKHKFKYIIDLDSLSVPPALMLALQIYRQFLKDIGVEL